MHAYTTFVGIFMHLVGVGAVYLCSMLLNGVRTYGTYTQVEKSLPINYAELRYFLAYRYYIYSCLRGSPIRAPGIGGQTH